TGAWTTVADDGAAGVFVDLACQVLAVALESRHDIELVAARSATRLDGAAIDHDRRAIEPAHGHEAAGHVFVAARDRDQGVVPLAAHHGFDGVGDQVARLERVAHALGAHRDTVADAHGVEPHANQPGLVHAFLYLGGQVQQMQDRKSTRLNSSHVKISYAVFCLKKKTEE